MILRRGFWGVSQREKENRARRGGEKCHSERREEMRMLGKGPLGLDSKPLQEDRKIKT